MIDSEVLEDFRQVFGAPDVLLGVPSRTVRCLPSVGLAQRDGVRSRPCAGSYWIVTELAVSMRADRRLTLRCRRTPVPKSACTDMHSRDSPLHSIA